jgi:hypothetical protein
MAKDSHVPVDLGLVTTVSAMSSLGALEAAEGQTESLRVQIETLDGKRYIVSLTVAAAKIMISGLATWSPMTEFLLERRSPVRLQ